MVKNIALFPLFVALCALNAANGATQRARGQSTVDNRLQASFGGWVEDRANDVGDLAGDGINLIGDGLKSAKELAKDVTDAAEERAASQHRMIV